MHTEAASPLVAERQRRTWTQIHQAAAAAAAEHGPDDVTVATIAAEAGISPRTFFNYFESKEDAIVGVQAPRLTDEALAELRESADLPPIVRVSRLVTSVATTTIGPGVDLAQRRALARSHPRLQARLTQVFTEARKLVLSRMVEDVDSPWPGVAGLPSDLNESRALVLLAGAVVTLAWTTDPDFYHRDRDDSLDAVIATFRKVTSTAL